MLLTALLIAAAPLQTQPAAPAPAPAPAVPAPAATPGLDTPVEVLMANPKTKAVVDANLPTLASHPSYEMFKGMSLNELAPMSNGALGDELLKKVAADLAAVK